MTPFQFRRNHRVEKKVGTGTLTRACLPRHKVASVRRAPMVLMTLIPSHPFLGLEHANHLAYTSLSRKCGGGGAN
jgi:hypothetical protein